MMTKEQLHTILAQRGYQQVESPDTAWRTWLWVAPLRENAIPTKLCDWACLLTEEGLHFLLDHNCELKSPYYSDEDRAANRNRASLLVEGDTTLAHPGRDTL
ncbi:MAG: hypothetical protein J2P36_04995 [Ktedonobacteraceae bacterium]|nr:hypothetical protein [Ktedonobacteraceae bacterium]